ncbi:unnamed protein product [Heterobilharzia americana]|nr:unnamed protein product [Heterobilharzia americana]
MVQRLGASREAFPTNYKHTSSTANAYAHSILKIRWPERISNKELWLGNEPITNPSTNKYPEESGDGLDWAYTEKTDWGHHAPGQVVEWNPKGKRPVGHPS